MVVFTIYKFGTVGKIENQLLTGDQGIVQPTLVRVRARFKNTDRGPRVSDLGTREPDARQWLTGLAQCRRPTLT
jgi:hypothetical protein